MVAGKTAGGGHKVAIKCGLLMRVLAVTQVLGKAEIEIELLGESALTVRVNGSKIVTDGTIISSGMRERLLRKPETELLPHRATG